MRADIEALRALTDRPFGVNLFAPPQAAADDVAPFAARLAAEAERYGAPVGEPRHDDDGWEAKLGADGRARGAGRLVHVRLPARRLSSSASARRG